jgi:hypothetical protein
MSVTKNKEMLRFKIEEQINDTCLTYLPGWYEWTPRSVDPFRLVFVNPIQTIGNSSGDDEFLFRVSTLDYIL